MAARKDRKKGWMVDFVFQHVDGRTERVRKRSPVQTRRGAEDYERQLRQERLNPKPAGKEAPTLAKFVPEFIDNYVRVNNKRGTLISKEQRLKNHIVPFFGKMRLTDIRVRQIECFKAELIDRGLKPKTVNNNLAVLSRLLRCAEVQELLGHQSIEVTLRYAHLSRAAKNQAIDLLNGTILAPCDRLSRKGMKTGS